MPPRYVYHDGVWQPVTGGGVILPPPPPPGTQPGGDWNDLVTHPQAIISKAGLPVQSAQWSLLNAMADGQRAYGGLASLGNLTTWTSNEENHIHRFGNGKNLMFRGGRIVGPMQEWNGTTGAYWEDQGLLDGNHYHGDTGWGMTRGLNATIEFVTVENTGDGISFGKKGLPGLDTVMGGADGSVVRRCVVFRVGDDCIENDWKDAVTIYKCFLSGVMLISTRPGNGSTPESTDTRNKIMTIDGCHMWRRGKRFRDLTPWGGSVGDKLAFSFFKWQQDHGTGPNKPEYGMQCHLFNCNLRTDGDPVYNSQANGVWGSLLTSGPNQRLTACSNNWLLQPYAAAGTYPIGWPKNDPIIVNGFSYAWGTEAANRWNDGANTFAAETPEVSMSAGDKGII